MVSGAPRRSFRCQQPANTEKPFRTPATAADQKARLLGKGRVLQSVQKTYLQHPPRPQGLKKNPLDKLGIDKIIASTPRTVDRKPSRSSAPMHPRRFGSAKRQSRGRTVQPACLIPDWGGTQKNARSCPFHGTKRSSIAGGRPIRIAPIDSISGKMFMNRPERFPPSRGYPARCGHHRNLSHALKSVLKEKKGPGSMPSVDVGRAVFAPKTRKATEDGQFEVSSRPPRDRRLQGEPNDLPRALTVRQQRIHTGNGQITPQEKHRQKKSGEELIEFYAKSCAGQNKSYHLHSRMVLRRRRLDQLGKGSSPIASAIKGAARPVNDLFVTKRQFLQPDGIDPGKPPNSILVKKMNKSGSLTETLDAVELAQDKRTPGPSIIIGSGETETMPTIADIRRPPQCPRQIKTGRSLEPPPIRRGQYNQLLRIRNRYLE